MQGRIIRLLAGFYFVQLGDREVRCRARGRLRLQSENPCVGDYVKISLLSDGEGVVDQVLPRRNVLERPFVANITQVVVVCAATRPLPNLVLLDRILVAAEFLGVSGVVVINKCDLDSGDQVKRLYTQAGYPVVSLSLVAEGCVRPLLPALRGHTSVLAGQSGVGKSSLIKHLCPEREVLVGEVNLRKGFGRHTTRLVELIYMPEWEAYVVDTPGFSKFDLPVELSSLALSDYFLEMRGLRMHCKFGHDCRHQDEPGCRVGQEVQAGTISAERYQSYIMLLGELKERERSQYK
ncbi:MAG: ribosome small subunit-dependent GTPase A [Thermaerobacter sp.]|nr:ribosome small subunit-dependent GTPase A [Thermaerobacter sp.]